MAIKCSTESPRKQNLLKNSPPCCRRVFEHADVADVADDGLLTFRERATTTRATRLPHLVTCCGNQLRRCDAACQPIKPIREVKVSSEVFQLLSFVASDCHPVFLLFGSEGSFCS